MPEFEIAGKRFNNPVEYVLSRIGGKWKIPILWRLKEKTYRYGELKRSLSRVTHKMLAQQLHELERDGLIVRKVYPEVPPRVEYSLTAKGRTVTPVIETLRKLGLEWMKQLERKPDGFGRR